MSGNRRSTALILDFVVLYQQPVDPGLMVVGAQLGTVFFLMRLSIEG